MASESTESASIDCWSAATNWIVAGGSLDASIAYDTSTADASAVVGGALLVAPPSQDSPACEIIVSFKKKHDIHMVYVRSTARTYELYCGTDQQSYSKDYLCTVRCSAVATEGAPDVCGEVTAESPKSTEQPVRAESHSSDEDGWVEVKVPDSSGQLGQVNLVSKDCVRNTRTNFEIHYEATAEISDATPAATLTLRLLSLQNKTCVHIEEIYIYADPVESTNSDPPASMGGNMGANLLAMLAPGLLQMPKFGTSRVDRRSDFDSDDSRMHENQHGIGKEFEASYSNTATARQEEAYSNIKDPEVGLRQEPTKIQQESTQSRASQKVPETVADESRVAYTRVEKVLDELVSRVGRIEAFCSRFEENMMKPLVGIDSRLQRLEQQLDAFSLKDRTSEPVPCFRAAAREVSFTASDPENRGCSTKYTAHDDTCSHGASLPADIAASPHDSPMCPGFVVKAPEFVSEDDESDDSLDSPVKDDSGDKTCVDYFEDDESDDSLDSPVRDHSGNKPLCLDDAMASALKAFLTSTSVKCPGPRPTDAPAELSNGENSCLASSTSEAEHIREPPSSADDIAVPNNLCKELDTENRGHDASEFGSENNGPVDSSSLAADKIIVAAEFPVSPHDYIDFDDVSVTRNCLEDQVRSPGALMVFLSSKMAKSSELSDDGKNKLASCTEVSFVEDDYPAGANHGNNKAKINLDLVLGDIRYSTGLCKNTNESCFGGGSTEDSDSEEAAAGDSRLNLHWSFSSTESSSNWGFSKFDPTSGLAAENCRNTWVDGGSKNYDTNTDSCKRSVVEIEQALQSVGYFGPVVDVNERNTDTLLGGINTNFNNNTASSDYVCGRSTVEIEEALRSVGHFDPNDQVPNSVGCYDLAVDLSGGSTLTSEESIANINDYNIDRPIIESEFTLSCLTDYNCSDLDLNFAPRNWKSEAVEDLLPGIFADTAIVGSEGTMGSEQQQCGRLPFDSPDQDQLLPGIDDAVVQLELHSGGLAQQGGTGIGGISNQLPFASLGGISNQLPFASLGGTGISNQLPFASLI